MPITAIFSASNCHGAETAKKLTKKLGYGYLSDDLTDSASKKFSVSKEKLEIAIFGTSTHFTISDLDRRLYISYFKSELLNALQTDDKVYFGFGTHLINPAITHVLKVCLAASFKYRVKQLMEAGEESEKDAKNLIRHDDRILFNWTQYLFNLNPADKSLYDIVLPMDKHTVDDAVEHIYSFAVKDVLAPTPASIQALKDEMLAVKVQIHLLEKKHNVEVTAKDGKVNIQIKKFVMFMEKYKRELSSLAENIEGVKGLEIGISKSFKTPSIASNFDVDIPKKILLVDDEAEFVQTLSERLKTRNIDSSIAYNGEEALERFETDPPEVMILDLKMPGINGLEVLEKVKKKHYNTEVIILTGHGSKQEEQAAFELGAFAYLEKPVDISILSETMQKAYDKVNKRKK